ncbi:MULTISPECIES: hypothetical protein [Synechococcales]|uniref:hypothetical protein n=1 Tax=Synechococcus sp. CS-1333 TaxID=2848638 RepID=UPI0037D9FD86
MLSLSVGGAFRLSPLYDILSAYSVMGRVTNQIAPQRATVAMALKGSRPRWRWQRPPPA